MRAVQFNGQMIFQNFLPI